MFLLTYGQVWYEFGVGLEGSMTSFRCGKKWEKVGQSGCFGAFYLYAHVTRVSLSLCFSSFITMQENTRVLETP